MWPPRTALYYPRKLRPFRVAFFFSGAALAGAFVRSPVFLAQVVLSLIVPRGSLLLQGGILAYGLGRIHTHSWKGWRFILVIEGALTVVIAALAYLVVPKYPQKAGFLAAPERARLLGALKKDSDSADNEPFNWRGVKQALTDPYCWGYALLFHGYSFVLYTLSLFSVRLWRALLALAAANRFSRSQRCSLLHGLTVPVSDHSTLQHRQPWVQELAGSAPFDAALRNRFHRDHGHRVRLFQERPASLLHRRGCGRRHHRVILLVSAF